MLGKCSVLFIATELLTVPNDDAESGRGNVLEWSAALLLTIPLIVNVDEVG